MEKHIGKINRFISRGIYPNFAVAVFILLENKNKNFIIVGNIESMHPDNVYEIEGEFHFDPIKNRSSFKVDNYKSYVSDDEEYMIKFLSSSSFPGVGKKMARKILEAYGVENLFDKILSNPKKIFECLNDDIKANIVVEKIDELFNKNNLDNIFLDCKLKIDFLNILKLKTNSQEEISNILENNFYEFAYENDFRTFKDIDDVYCAFHSDRFSEERVSWHAWNIVNQILNNNKHTYIDYELLISELMNTFLDKTRKEIEEKLSFSQKNNILYFKKPNRVYSKESYEDEQYIVNTLYSLFNGRNFVNDYEDYDIEKNFKEVEEWMAKKIGNTFVAFNLLQKEAIFKIINNDFEIITGGPGTGKSIVISAIVKMLKTIDKNNLNQNDIAIVAPTGRAASRIRNSTGLETSTIHRLLNYGGGKKFKVNVDNPIYKKILIIDECSMIDQSLFANLLRGIKGLEKIILVGDIDQLPSIGYGNIFHDLILLKEFPTTQLTENIRQGQSEKNGIVDLSHAIKDENWENFNFDNYQNLKLYENDDVFESVVKDILLPLNASMNDDIDRIQFVTPQKNINLGVKNINNFVQPFYVDTSSSHFYQRSDYKYFVGDRIICTENTPDLGIFNGDMGIITELNFDKNRFIYAKANFNEENVTLSSSNFSSIELAYACTIHKTQGSEYENVVLIVDHKNDRGFANKKMLYTAVTRAKKKIFIYCDKTKFISYSKRKDRQRNTSLIESYLKIFKS